MHGQTRIKIRINIFAEWPKFQSEILIYILTRIFS